MNPEIKQAWIDALRSGNYLQGKHGLQPETGKFCCLGVLSDLACKAGVAVAYRTDPEDGWTYRSVSDEQDLSDVSLINAIMEWAEIPQELGFEVSIDVRFDGISRRLLSAANDSGATFNEIADAIEASL